MKPDFASNPSRGKAEDSEGELESDFVDVKLLVLFLRNWGRGDIYHCLVLCGTGEADEYRRVGTCELEVDSTLVRESQSVEIVYIV
jgi:hypothetical protein